MTATAGCGQAETLPPIQIPAGCVSLEDIDTQEIVEITQSPEELRASIRTVINKTDQPIVFTMQDVVHGNTDLTGDVRITAGNSTVVIDPYSSVKMTGVQRYDSSFLCSNQKDATEILRQLTGYPEEALTPAGLSTPLPVTALPPTQR